MKEERNEEDQPVFRWLVSSNELERKTRKKNRGEAMSKRLEAKKKATIDTTKLEQAKKKRK